MRRFVVSALTAACAGSALLAPIATGASPPLTVVAGTENGAATVSFTRASNGELRGRINLVVRSTADGRISVIYKAAGPVGGLDAGTIRFAGAYPQAARGEFSAVNLVAALPKSASPSDYEGVLVLRIGRSTPTLVKVRGQGSPLPGVRVEPSTLHVRVTDWKGPLDPFDKAGATVLLSGPGVPAMFRRGAGPPHTVLLLRSDSGESVYGRIDFLKPENRDNPTVARAIVSVPGNIDPGRYTVTAPISSLSAASPRLSIELEASHAFAWAVLAILLGAFAAGRRRNAVQTLAIALLVATAYVAIVYGPTWGTLLDYAGALAAGFVGQLVIGRLAARRLK